MSRDILNTRGSLPNRSSLPQRAFGSTGDGGGGGGSTLTDTYSRGEYPVLNASSVSDTEVLLQSTTVDGASSYEFQVADDENFSSNLSTIQNTSSRSATHSGLSLNDVKYYRVRAVGSNEEAWSKTRKVTVSAPEFPDDQYSMATGWSLQKLSSTYSGNAIRVRRESDNAEQDIGFQHHMIDIPALEDFAQGGTLRVVTLYDQVESGEYTTGSTSEPIIARGGVAVMDEWSGRPVMDFSGDNLSTGGFFNRATNLSSSINEADSMVALNGRITGDRANQEESGWGKPVTSNSFDPGNLGFRRYFFEKGGETLGGESFEKKPRGVRYWVGARFGSSNQEKYIGPEVATETTNSVSGTYSNPELGCQNPYYLAEGVIFTGVTSKSAYRNRLWSCDDRWNAAPTESQWNARGYMDCRFQFQGEIIDWLSSNSVSDFIPYTVSSVDAGSSQVTIGGVDWSHLQSGDTIFLDGSSFTLSSSPSVSGSDTVCTVNESLSSISSGDEAHHQPYYDGTNGTQNFSDEDAANLRQKVELLGDSTVQMNLNGLANPGWYVKDTGESLVSPQWSDWCVLDESNPDTTNSQPNQLQIQNTGSNRKIGLTRIDLSGLSSVPSVANIRPWIDNHGTEDNGKPYLGIVLYEGVSWDSTTLTWNDLSGLAINPNDPYDDEEGLDYGSEEQVYVDLYLAGKIRQAYNNGASSVTLMWYHVEDQDESWGTTSTSVYIDSPNATNPPENNIYQAFGWNATDSLRVPDVYDGLYNYGGGREVAFWSDLSMPYQGGEGNPWKGSEEMKRRGVMIDLLQVSQHILSGNLYDWTRYFGGYISSLSEAIELGPSVLGLDIKEAAKQGVEMLSESGRQGTYDAGANANLDVKVIEGNMAAYKTSGPVERKFRTRLLESSRRIAFNNRSGDPTTDEAIWHKEGNFYEGSTPEGSYNNRSLSHLVRGRVKTWGSSDWDWIDTIIKRMVDFQQMQFGYAKDGTALDCSGYSGRTTDAVLGGQWKESAKAAIPLISDAGRYWSRDWGNDSDRIQDGQSEASAAKNEIDSLGSFNRNTSAAPIYDPKSSWQALPGYHPPVDGWFSTVRSWYSNDEPFIYPLAHPKSGDSRRVEVRPSASGEEDWMFGKVGPSSKEIAFFVDGRRESGDYNGAWGGVHFMWSKDYGTIISTRRPGSLGDQKIVEGIIGYDTDGSNYAFWAAFNGSTADQVSWDGTNEQFVHEISYPRSGSDPTASDASFSRKKTYTVLDENNGDAQTGLQIQLDVNYSAGSGGRDQVNMLAWDIPLARIAQSMKIDYWDGSAWLSLSEGGEATAQEWRVRQEFSSGDETVWLRFGSDTTIRREPELSQQDTNGVPMRAVLLGGDGSAVDIPDSTSKTLTVTTTDPGFTQTVASVSTTYPKEGATFYEGELWMGQGEVTVPSGVTLSEVWYEYSTDNGSTWSTIASQDVSTGTKVSGASGGLLEDDGSGTYSYAGDDVAAPSGLTNVRFRTVAGSGDESSQSAGVSATSPTLQAEDTFTDTNGVLLANHTMDTGPGWSGSTDSFEIQSNELVSNSGFVQVYVGLSNVNKVIKSDIYAEDEASIRSREYGSSYIGVGFNASRIPRIEADTNRSGYSETINLTDGSGITQGNQYQFVLVQIDDTIIGRILDSGGSVLGTEALFGYDTDGIQDPQTAAINAGDSGTGETYDNFEAYT